MRNKESIEKFILEQRTAFDQSDPQGYVWESLERCLRRIPDSDSLERQIMMDRPLLDTAEAPNLWSKIERALPVTDPLEAFIAEHREQMDVFEPHRSLWEKVESDLPNSKVVKMQWWQIVPRRLTSIAASIALLIIGLGIGVWYGRSDAKMTSSGMALREVSTEYAELETYYENEISSKKAALANYTGEQTEEVTKDLTQMDKAMNELRCELSKVPPGNREQVVRAMIENYQARTAILKRVLERLDNNPTEDDSSESPENKFKSI
ncbi:MAG: hypothetical protein IT269_03630 [Saprospiraceae bacterium]|nr:hypothetical protein [Saprospiraceae bacterium]